MRLKEKKMNTNILFRNFKELHTLRFYIRGLQTTDAKDLYEIFSDFETVKYQQIPPMENMEQAEQTIVNFKKGYDDKQKIRRCIVDLASNKVLGLISLHTFNEANSSACIGFMLNRKYWNNGIMTETAQKLIEYVFESTDLNIIEARVVPQNIGSRKVCEKLNFKEIDFKEKNVLNFRDKTYEDQYIYQLQKNTN